MKKTLLTILILLGLAFSSAADESDGSRPALPLAGHDEIDVRLVQLPVLARDKNGTPVTDLRAEELIVEDRGEAVAVAFLEPFVRGLGDRAALPAVRLALDLPGGGEGKPPVAAMATNSPAAEPRHMVIFIDVENDQPLGKTAATEDLLRVLRDVSTPEDRIAVLSFDGEVRLEQTFTADRGDLSRAIRAAFARPPRPQVDLALRVRQLIDRVEDCVEDGQDREAVVLDADEVCLAAVATDHAEEVRPRAASFLDALEGVVRFTAGLEGRKSVVAITHGVAMDPAAEVAEAMRAVIGNSPLLARVRLDLMSGEGVRHQLDALLDLAIRSEVTLHAIDRTREPAGDSSARLAHAYRPGARPMLAAWTAAQADLRQIAAATGGTFLATADLYDGVREALELERGGYLLGFYAQAYLSNDRLAKITVRSQRKGVRILHRRGAYARPAADADLPALRGRIALGAPQRAPADDGERMRVPFHLLADPTALGYREAGESTVADLTLHVVVETEDGRDAASAYHFVAHAYPTEVWRTGDLEPLTVAGWVELPRGRYRLRAKLRNAATGAGGVLSQDLVVASRDAVADRTKAPSQ